jgi:hypothetical protein
MKNTYFRIAAAGLAAAALAGAAWAQDASSLRASGKVGEQADGYMGCVATCDSTTQAAINSINAKRAQAYAEIAAKTGVSPAAAGQAAGQKLIDQLGGGQYYKPLNGGWTRK